MPWQVQHGRALEGRGDAGLGGEGGHGREHAVEAGGCAWGVLDERRGGLEGGAQEHLRGVEALKAVGAAQRRLDGDAKGEEVAARVEGQGLHLLRRHEGGGADDVAGLGHGLIAHRARDAEVEELHGAIAGDHHVARLEIAVEHGERVRAAQARQQLSQHLGGHARGEGPPRINHGGLLGGAREGVQGVAVDELHGDEVGVVVVGLEPIGDQPADVVVLQRRAGAHLAQKARARLFLEHPGQQLEGHGGAGLVVDGGEDGGHAALAELAAAGEAREGGFGGGARAHRSTPAPTMGMSTGAVPGVGFGALAPLRLETRGRIGRSSVAAWRKMRPLLSQKTVSNVEPLVQPRSALTGAMVSPRVMRP